MPLADAWKGDGKRFTRKRTLSRHFMACRVAPWRLSRQPTKIPSRRRLWRLGSVGLAALIAHLTFWVLVAYGWLSDASGPKELSVV